LASFGISGTISGMMHPRLSPATEGLNKGNLSPKWDFGVGVLSGARHCQEDPEAGIGGAASSVAEEYRN
jgi:hypothetical protein